VLLALALGLSLAGAARAAAGQEILTITTRDGARDAILIRASKRRPAPTVIVLHGRFVSAERTIVKYRFDETALGHGFNAVFPDGMGRRWQDGRMNGPKHATDDVGFLRALVDRLVKDGIADRRRIYLAGISNGGMMSYTLACKAGDLFAGMATVISSMPKVDADCRLRPMPVVMINGSKDPVMPYEGGAVARLKKQGAVIGADPTFRRFGIANGCSHVVTTPMPDSNPDDGVSILKRQWVGCRSGRPVIAYDILGGGHAVPGPNSLPVHFFGKASPDIDTAATIMNFFAGLR
jgi:polyhydroxybutyrate depolymerase